MSQIATWHEGEEDVVVIVIYREKTARDTENVADILFKFLLYSIWRMAL